MIRVLIIGLLWLSFTGAMCVLIGRAIRSADLHDAEQARHLRAGQWTRWIPGPVAGGEARATLYAPDLAQLFKLSEAGTDEDALPGAHPEPAPRDFPWPERHPDRPRDID
jgi:hypothetical protein